VLFRPQAVNIPSKAVAVIIRSNTPKAEGVNAAEISGKVKKK
jgi:hypothetical protein